MKFIQASIMVCRYHNHSELNAFINAIAAVPVQRRKESDQYFSIVNAVLDIYLGKLPESFTYKGVGYTPKSFAASLQINPDDYVEISSFTLFPFYTKGVVPFPDNWRNANYYNVPLDELIEIMDYSLKNGYTVNWDGDVSEKGFSHSKGVAIIPEIEKTDLYPSADKVRFGKMTREERAAEAYKFSKPFPEVKVTQESREAGYDNKKQLMIIVCILPVLLKIRTAPNIILQRTHVELTEIHSEVT